MENGDGEMFIGFSVSNFLSFKTTQTMSMIASKVARHKQHILMGNGKKVLKTGLIYGANAGGKSNFIKAILLPLHDFHILSHSL